jgi:aspartate-semialdehyde dehydrogenase
VVDGVTGYAAKRAQARRLCVQRFNNDLTPVNLMASPAMSKRFPVGILGATGIVGQRFIQLLEHHPWFEVAWLAASERSEGKQYAEAARWKLTTPIPQRVAEMRVSEADPKDAPGLIFAALDAAIATELEPKFAEAGKVVITNSSALRMNEDVPLIIPEVNADHLRLLERQSWRKNGGFVVTNANCSAIGLVMALSPLRQFGIEKVMAVTMQAISGAGYPGVASLDILGNVIPYIGSEEEKMERETRKMLGTMNGTGVKAAEFAMSAQCNRVSVEDGHTESVSISFAQKPSAEEIIRAWEDSAITSAIRGLKLPSAPDQPVIYDRAVDRPQPRLDVNRGSGMSATVGRLRPCGVLDWKFTVLSHNVIRGAAGAAILNAELLKAKGYLDA